MKQRTRMLIELPKNSNVIILEKELKLLGCKIKCLSVFNPINGIKVPSEYLFDDELPKVKDAQDVNPVVEEKK